MKLSPRQRLQLSLSRGTVAAIEQLIDERVRDLDEERRRIEQRPLLTVAEFARRSGRSEKAVRRLVEKGQLTPVREDGRVLLRAADLP